MRKIRGFVCIAGNKNYAGEEQIAEILFGRNMGGGKIGNFENFQTNNLTPFKSLSKAKAAAEGISNMRDVVSVSFAHIRMDIIETEEEISCFKGKRNLVVVRKEEEGLGLLIGEAREGAGRYPLYGSELALNGMKPFSSFDDAYYVASEEHRQSQCPAFLATFKLKRL